MAVDVDATLGEIGEWAANRNVTANLDEIGFMLELSRDHFGHRAVADWEPGQFNELLLRVYPAQVEFESDEDAADIADAARQLVEFLGDAKGLPEQVAGELRAELDEAEEVLTAAILDGMDESNGLVTMLEQLGVPTDRLPPVRLPDQAELAAAARQSPLLARARAGEGAPELAEFVGFVDVQEDETRVPGESLDDWPDGDDEDVLAVWQDALAFTLGFSLDVMAEQDDAEIDFEGVGVAVFVMLYLGRASGVELADLTAMIQDSTEEPEQWDAWVAAHGDPAKTLVDQLAELGAVVEEEGSVRLTPLGLDAMREQFVEAGVEVPLLPPADEMTAADLARVAYTFSEQEMAAELAAWTALRGEQDAARDLVSFAATSGSLERVWVSKVVDGLGAAATDAWRAGIESDLVRPYAKLALAKLAGDVSADHELDLAELASVTLDAIAVSALTGDHLPESLTALLPAGQEQELLDAMWRSPNPDTPDLLQVVGQFHPDKKVAKHARKVAHKAASFHSRG